MHGPAGSAAFWAEVLAAGTACPRVADDPVGRSGSLAGRVGDPVGRFGWMHVSRALSMRRSIACGARAAWHSRGAPLPSFTPFALLSLCPLHVQKRMQDGAERLLLRDSAVLRRTGPSAAGEGEGGEGLRAAAVRGGAGLRKNGGWCTFGTPKDVKWRTRRLGRHETARGGMAERLNAAVLKTARRGDPSPGFKSPSLRQCKVSSRPAVPEFKQACEGGVRVFPSR